MNDDSWLQSSLYLAITPLYGLVCDVDDLQIDTEFRIRKYEPTIALPFAGGDPLLRSLSVIQPNYLLWYKPDMDKQILAQTIAQASYSKELDGLHRWSAAIQVVFFLPCINLFRLLRLFKPGRLRGGDTYVVSCGTKHEQQKWASIASHRCTRMTIDPGVPFEKEADFSLDASDVPLFSVFQARLQPIIESVRQDKASPCPSLELALDLYAREDFDAVDVVNALTALEALLLNGGTTELTYRLSVRVAYLLGTDATSRKKIFADMKGFYDLRSTVVHGSELKPKHLTRLEQLHDLREIVRRTLLTVMALISEGISRSSLEELFDEILFDEGRRLEVQKIAAKLLCVGTTPSVRVQ